MAGLITGRDTAEIEGGRILVLPVGAGAKIFDGALVVIDEEGYAKPAIKAENLRAVGRAEEFVDNTHGGNGDLRVEVRRGVFIWENDSTNAVTMAEMLTNCYMVDDHTVCSLATGSSVAGKIVGIFEDGIAVETI